MGKCSLLDVTVPKYSNFLLLFSLSTAVFILRGKVAKHKGHSKAETL